jgi:hypothetical protein
MYATKRKLNWGTFRKNFPWVKNIVIMGKIFEFTKKSFFLTWLRKKLMYLWKYATK